MSRAVDDIAVRFLKMPASVRVDIRRYYIAHAMPPANMMNIHTPVAWTPNRSTRAPRHQLPVDYCPERPIRPTGR